VQLGSAGEAQAVWAPRGQARDAGARRETECRRRRRDTGVRLNIQTLALPIQ
jgi:hypothetical protein